MIDIAMTAAIRPDIVERTIRSIGENIEYRPLRLVVDIAPVGEISKYSSGYMVEFIESLCLRYGIDITYRALAVSWQAEALKWTWKESRSAYILQWEDDWVLREKLDLKILIAFMVRYPKIGMLYLDRYKKSVLDYKGYKGVFAKSHSGLYMRLKGKSLGGPPALLRQEYTQAVIPIIKDNVCLDTMSGQKATQALLKNWTLSVYVGEDGKGNLVEDIGKKWKKDNNLKMKKSTKVGVQWVKR